MADTKISAETTQDTLSGAKLLGVNGTPLNRAFPGYAFWGEKGADVTSAGTLVLGDDGDFFHITGTTTITDIDFNTAKNGRHAWLEFDGALTLTHNATTLNLPGGANIVTAAGDRALVVQDSSDNVHVLAYQRANGGLVTSEGTAPVYGARAFVVFNGTGTVAIRKARNVSSITDNATGDWTVNLTTAMPDADYIVLVSVSANFPGDFAGPIAIHASQSANVAPTTTAFRLATRDIAGTAKDYPYVNCVVFA